MTDEEKKAAADAAAKTEADAKAKVDADAAAAAQAANPETIGEVLAPKTEEKPAPKMVPEAAFLDLKNANKDLKKEMADLRKSIEDGATANEVSADIEAIAEKYDVKLPFLKELATAIRKETEQDIKKGLEPLTAKDRAAKVEEVFKTHFDKAMEAMPEYAKIVNRETIKTLSLDPKNHNKTFVQLIEETYGNALPAGKRTLETTTPRGGKSSDGIDFERAKTDMKYFSEIMADPDMKKEYNSSLVSRIGGQL